MKTFFTDFGLHRLHTRLHNVSTPGGVDVIRGEIGKFLAWSFISVTSLQIISC